jgi:hypothetical protein
MVHKFFSIGYCGIDKPHIQHEKKTNQKQDLPVPFFFQLCQGIVTGDQVVNKKHDKGEQCELDGKVYESAVPGNKREYQE